MSVRAYKIKKIEFEDNPTFNLWHDNGIWEKAHHNNLDDSGGGYLTFFEEEVKEQIKDETDKDTKEILKDILSDMGDDDSVEYVCF